MEPNTRVWEYDGKCRFGIGVNATTAAVLLCNIYNVSSCHRPYLYLSPRGRGNEYVSASEILHLHLRARAEYPPKPCYFGPFHQGLDFNKQSRVDKIIACATCSLPLESKYPKIKYQPVVRVYWIDFTALVRILAEECCYTYLQCSRYTSQPSQLDSADFFELVIFTTYLIDC